MKYRPEIDGLRAIAVVAVIIYHAGLLPLPGGYLGVDIFFVISGYLITSIIVREIDEGRFTIRGFYARRARRILPALYAVTLASLPLGLYFLIPVDLGDLAKSAVAVTLFIPNFHFWDTADYFARSAEFKPLLHTWSLGVEEQFYVIFPLLLMALAARRRPLVLGLIIAASIAAAAAFRPRDFDAVFYLLPFRAWELAMGALAALLETRLTARVKGPLPRDVAGLAGLGLMAVALVLPESLQQGLLAQLIAVAGATLALLFWRHGTVAARVMGSAPLAGIGLISYSAYLWHQPILAFARSIDGLPLTTGFAALLVGLTFVISYLSWRFIEQPFRQAARVPTARFVPAMVALFVVINLLAAAILYITQKSDALLTPLQKQVFLTAEKSPAREACHLRKESYRSPAEACVFNDKPARVAVLGNSHAVELAYDLGQALAPVGVAQFSYSACPPAYGRIDPRFAECSRWTNDVVDYIAANADIRSVVISYALTGVLPGITQDAPGEAETRPGGRKSLFAMIDTLLASGKDVVMVLEAPRLPRHIQYYIKDVASEADASRLASISSAGWAAVLAGLKQDMNERYAGEAGRFVLIDPADRFCAGDSCAAILDGKALYFDDNHMSLSGAALVAADVAADVAAQLKAP